MLLHFNGHIAQRNTMRYFLVINKSLLFYLCEANCG